MVNQDARSTGPNPWTGTHPLVPLFPAHGRRHHRPCHATAGHTADLAGPRRPPPARLLPAAVLQAAASPKPFPPSPSLRSPCRPPWLPPPTVPPPVSPSPAVPLDPRPHGAAPLPTAILPPPAAHRPSSAAAHQPKDAAATISAHRPPWPVPHAARRIRQARCLSSPLRPSDLPLAPPIAPYRRLQVGRPPSKPLPSPPSDRAAGLPPSPLAPAAPAAPSPPPVTTRHHCHLETPVRPHGRYPPETRSRRRLRSTPPSTPCCRSSLCWPELLSVPFHDRRLLPTSTAHAGHRAHHLPHLLSAMISVSQRSPPASLSSFVDHPALQTRRRNPRNSRSPWNMKSPSLREFQYNLNDL